MDAASVLVMIAILLIVITYVFQPLFTNSRRQPAQTNRGLRDLLRTRAELLAERNRVYVAIRALDLDYSANKIADGDYTAQRYQLVASGVELLKQLDALPSLDETPAGEPIEARVAVGKQSGQAQAAAGRSRRSKAKGQPKPAGQGSFCPRCGKPIKRSDRFCGSCGAPL